VIRPITYKYLRIVEEEEEEESFLIISPHD
jgi:hypothetical protein